MLLSAVSVLVVAQSSSEIPEGLMNNPVFYGFLSPPKHTGFCFIGYSAIKSGCPVRRYASITEIGFKVT